MNFQKATSIKSATKAHKTGDTVITALQPTTFDFTKKDLTHKISPSGSGKTTLFSLPGCVNLPYSGEVYINNPLVNNLSCVFKKTHVFFTSDKKTSKTRLASFLRVSHRQEFLKTRSLFIINDCFKNEHNAVFGVFLQRLNMKDRA